MQVIQGKWWASSSIIYLYIEGRAKNLDTVERSILIQRKHLDLVTSNARKMMNNEETIWKYVDEVMKKSDEAGRSKLIQRKHIEKYIVIIS